MSHGIRSSGCPEIGTKNMMLCVILAMDREPCFRMVHEFALSPRLLREGNGARRSPTCAASSFALRWCPGAGSSSVLMLAAGFFINTTEKSAPALELDAFSQAFSHLAKAMRGLVPLHEELRCIEQLSLEQMHAYCGLFLSRTCVSSLKKQSTLQFGKFIDC